MTKLILKYTGLLLTGFLLVLLVGHYDILPKYISGTPINIRGLLILSMIFASLIFLDKELLLQDNSISAIKLTGFGTLPIFISELIFQLIKQTTIADFALSGRITDLFNRVISMTILSCALAFIVSFQIKTKKTGWTVLWVILILLSVYLFMEYYLNHK